MAETTRLRTAKAFVAMFANLDMDLLSSLLAPSYQHTFAPASVGDQLGTKSKDEMIAHLGSFKALMTGFPVYAKHYWESDTENMVTMWATSKVEWRDEVTAADAGEWEFEGEYMFLLWMDETGEKIVKAIEYLDSLKTVKAFGLMGKAREKVEASKGQ